MLGKGNTYSEDLEVFSQKLFSTTKEAFPEVFSQKPKRLKESILKASNQYIFDENTSLWSETWFKEAYAAYFIFTQTARLFYVFRRLKNTLPLDEIGRIVDFGCGPASAHIAARAVFKGSLDSKKWTNIDSSKEAIDFARRIEKPLALKSDLQIANKIPPPKSKKDLLILSFSICEGLNLEEVLNYNHVLILEPGQLKSSKNLIAFRKSALEKNFKVLAPCTHQLECPMSEGAKSWCHDTAPKPKVLNQYDLPFSKNRLNFSYLLLSKDSSSQNSDGLTRVIGDLQPEKGKTKVAICRNKEVEFLSWLKRDLSKKDQKKAKTDALLSRGDLIKLHGKLVTKGQEVRVEEFVEKVF